MGADLSVEVERESDAVPVPLIAGDAVVLHCHLLHRSENLSPGGIGVFFFCATQMPMRLRFTTTAGQGLGLCSGKTRFPEVAEFERDLFAKNETS